MENSTRDHSLSHRGTRGRDESAEKESRTRVVEGRCLIERLIKATQFRFNPAVINANLEKSKARTAVINGLESTAYNCGG